MGAGESEYSVQVADAGRIRKFRELVDRLRIKD
jgi:hypothetical protein